MNAEMEEKIKLRKALILKSKLLELELLYNKDTAM